MPRIQAPSVAEHRKRQRRAILDAARAIIAETGEAPSPGAVGARIGLARPSIYQYFPSRDALLDAVVADVFPAWTAHVLDHVAAAATPADRVWAYVEANVALFTGPEQAVAKALRTLVAPAVLQEHSAALHARLREPLIDSLRELGEPDPEHMAELINAAVLRACHDIDADDGSRALRLLDALLRPYLREREQGRR
ncbi:transcriptional regulator, TetR family [Pseudonocardia thermophila]|mgnify:CR=1 FL=1|uniref:Transcriptional regulator, TetR family n=1 Tax=Pseudonocardia thermophila TaxID=1848 RepID=A0A1M6Y6P9_PSETH|nr:TetR/AcrR family transcriptional regulator [Pseudonocardia thermophila]SHL13842.1 transcriptional regulator, TetR family [Pseudonocardia thermophila]